MASSYIAALTASLPTQSLTSPNASKPPAAISNIFADLCTTYPSWGELHDFLVSDEGGKLQVLETADSPHLVVIRYVKDKSNTDIGHVRAFRSVVWNTDSNRPVSVTAWKSETGEGLPDFTGVLPENIRVEEFVDGVMIGQFFDTVTGKWRIHTRSTMDGKCRYYSKTRTFADLFHQVAHAEDLPVLLEQVPKDLTLTWVLSHPENRIVCPVQKSHLTLVACTRISDESATIEEFPVPTILRRFLVTPITGYKGLLRDGFTGLPELLHTLVALSGSITSQGIVVKLDGQPFRRWKLRSTVYNTVRRMRGNSARLDFLWMDLWSRGGLEAYLKFYPEERRDALSLVQRWKDITQTAYNTYVEVFKARTSPRDSIPAKIKPLVLGLHQEYLAVLRPSKKSLDWRAAKAFLNARDTAQKIYIVNWDARQESQHMFDLRHAKVQTSEVSRVEPTP